MYKFDFITHLRRFAPRTIIGGPIVVNAIQCFVRFMQFVINKFSTTFSCAFIFTIYVLEMQRTDTVWTYSMYLLSSDKQAMTAFSHGNYGACVFNRIKMWQTSFVWNAQVEMNGWSNMLEGYAWWRSGLSTCFISTWVFQTYDVEQYCYIFQTIKYACVMISVRKSCHYLFIALFSQ